MIRVLITGSRDYAERFNNLPERFTSAEETEAKRLDLIDLRKAWKYFNQALKFATEKGESITFIHGDCPRGFDKICSQWISNMQKNKENKTEIIEEKHPADWVEHGAKAGPIRNEEMVKSGADYVISGWDGKRDNSGTLDCMSRAVMAGIDIKNCSPVKE